MDLFAFKIIAKENCGMDVIYHRNCLDGVFSAYLLYLLSKRLNEETLAEYLSVFQKRISEKKQNPASYEMLSDLTMETIKPSSSKSEKMLHKEEGLLRIEEQFFHNQCGVNYSAYSLFAGEYIPLKFPSKNKVLFILDTNLVAFANIKDISQRYDVVILIDHHTSFKEIKSDILLQKLNKLFYVFTEEWCAAQLSYRFISQFFGGFENHYQEEYLFTLQEMISYVGKNDMKKQETKKSKQFVLGFYHFEIELSHFNPLLNKRLGLLNFAYLMEKGSNLYKMHLKQLSFEISRAEICKINMNGPYKDKKCLLSDPLNPKKISDIGNILAFLSVKHEMENLAILMIPGRGEIRVSTRSHHKMKNPLALELSQKFQGGGHTCAAGFKVTSHKFKSAFLREPTKIEGLKLSPEEVEQILLFNGDDENKESVEQTS